MYRKLRRHRRSRQFRQWHILQLSHHLIALQLLRHSGSSIIYPSSRHGRRGGFILQGCGDPYYRGLGVCCSESCRVLSWCKSVSGCHTGAVYRRCNSDRCIITQHTQSCHSTIALCRLRSWSGTVPLRGYRGPPVATRRASFEWNQRRDGWR